jgi:hypothetical protein
MSPRVWLHEEKKESMSLTLSPSLKRWALHPCVCVVSSDNFIFPPWFHNSSYTFLGCDVVLPIRALIPPLPDPVRNGVQLSATTRVEIKFDKGLQQWCVTSSTSRVGLCSARSANASPTLELPVDGGEFLLRLKTKQGMSKNLCLG